jgi:hypothetical protein
MIDLKYVSFSKLPFNNNETNFQIEQTVLLISLSIVLCNERTKISLQALYRKNDTEPTI